MSDGKFVQSSPCRALFAGLAASQHPHAAASGFYKSTTDALHCQNDLVGKIELSSCEATKPSTHTGSSIVLLLGRFRPWSGACAADMTLIVPS